MKTIEKLGEIQHNLDLMGAEIRNKLSPVQQLLTLIEAYELNDDPGVKARIWAFILKEKETVKLSIEYLKNLL